jgi:hypothetical protein
MWSEILSANAKNAAPELRALGQALLRAAEAIESGTLRTDGFEGASERGVGVGSGVLERSISGRLRD